mgnify:FL=1
MKPVLTVGCYLSMYKIVRHAEVYEIFKKANKLELLHSYYSGCDNCHFCKKDAPYKESFFLYDEENYDYDYDYEFRTCSEECMNIYLLKMLS